MCVWKQCNKHYLEKTLGRKRWMRINFVLKEFTVHQIIFMGLNCLFLPSLLSHSWKQYRKGSRESQLQIQRSKRQRIWDHLEYIPEKAMATHSSTLAWKIPWMEEPGRLQSTGLLRVRHDWATSLSLFTFMHWGGKWQPTPVFLPGDSQGQRSLLGCRLWGRTEWDMTEVT